MQLDSHVISERVCRFRLRLSIYFSSVLKILYTISLVVLRQRCLLRSLLVLHRLLTQLVQLIHRHQVEVGVTRVQWGTSKHVVLLGDRGQLRI